jgi:hypothetical protein
LFAMAPTENQSRPLGLLILQRPDSPFFAVIEAIASMTKTNPKSR